MFTISYFLFVVYFIIHVISDILPCDCIVIYFYYIVIYFDRCKKDERSQQQAKREPNKVNVEMARKGEQWGGWEGEW